MKRHALLTEIAERIQRIDCAHPLRVAIDGIDGAGKTHFADELAPLLDDERQIIRASVDGFHRPRAERYRRGRLSPEGYYRDAFDYPGLIKHLLAPLGPGGTRRFRVHIFDHRRDVEDLSSEDVARDDAILLLDGVFLQREELEDLVDYRIHLKVDRREALSRAAERDPESPESPDDPLNRRYIGAHAMYFAACDPETNADTLILNQPLDDPTLLR